MNREPIPRSGLPRTLATLALLTVVIAGVRAAAPVLQPLLVALFLAIGTSPVLRWVRVTLRGPRSLAIIAAITVNLVFASVLLYAFGRSLAQISILLPTYSERFSEIQLQLVELLQRVGLRVEPTESPLSFEELFGFGTFAVGRIATMGSMVLLVLLIVAFIFIESGSFQHRYRWLRRNRAQDGDLLASAYRDVQVYLGLKTAISAATGVTAFLLCGIVGIPFALLWGTLAFLLNFIPFIGSVIASVPPLLLALLEAGWVPAALVGVGYLAINITFANIVEPRVFGRATKLSPLVILIGVVFWGWVLGPVGALIAVPVTTSVKLGLERSPEWRWIAVLMSAGTPVDKEGNRVD